MDYAKLFFEKSLNDLTYEDIELFFSVEQEETQNIEFKSFHEQSTFDKNISNVIRGICSFLNSEGGVLIWGAPSGKRTKDRKEEIFVGSLSPVNLLKEKDSLINLISSRITTLPIGISVKILTKGLGHLYIFEIQESSIKPHQYNDRYYIRLDGQSIPAPHYLIEALFKRINYPDINGFIKFERLTENHQFFFLNFSIFLCNFSEYQNEENVSFQLVVFPGKISQNDSGQYFSKERSVLHYGRPSRENHNLSISANELAKHNFKIKISLNFGGKHSPAKTSNYTLNLSKAIYTQHDENANKLIESFEENVLFSDYQDRIGKSKDTFVKDILER